jgi:hypothetical protein
MNMSKFRFSLTALAIMALTLMISASAQAQATRTWVSAVGNDADPCSRTAPCKTFSGAQSKTAINGEIDAIDPGGYGTISIVKSLTIDGGTGSGWGSILASGTVGVSINIATSVNDPQKTVRLRHLSINGTGPSGSVGTRTGTTAVSVSTLSAAGTTLIVQEVLIDGFTTTGINATFGASGGNLVVEDSYIQECGSRGIFLSATGGFAVGSIRNVRVHRVATGMEVGANGFATVEDSNSSENTGDAFKASSSTAVLNVNHSIMAHNGGAGANASVSGATIRVASNSVYNNTNSFLIAAGATIASDSQNRVAANGGGVAPNGAIPIQ